MASLARNSRTEDRITARPSPLLEYGVNPEPCGKEKKNFMRREIHLETTKVGPKLKLSTPSVATPIFRLLR